MRVSDLHNLETGLEINVIREAIFDYCSPLDSKFFEDRALVFIENLNYLYMLNNEKISCVILDTNKIEIEKITGEIGIVSTSNPRKLFYLIHNYICINQKNKTLMSPTSVSLNSLISKTAVIASEGVRIGKNCIIGDFTVIKGPVLIGDSVIIGDGVRIGADGFQYYTDKYGVIKILSSGGVVIESHSEIKNNSCIDRGVFGGNTLIRSGAKIDNLVHVGHDCSIGENTIIVAGSSIGGRTKIGRGVWIGINSTISNNIVIGDYSKILMGSVVSSNVPKEETYSGFFASDHQKNLISQIKLKRLK